jgi:hypothetical protein
MTKQEEQINNIVHILKTMNTTINGYKRSAPITGHPAKANGAKLKIDENGRVVSKNEQ